MAFWPNTFTAVFFGSVLIGGFLALQCVDIAAGQRLEYVLLIEPMKKIAQSCVSTAN